MAAFVLGNGISRELYDTNKLLTIGPVYGCNAIYRTNRITALVATDQPIAKVIQDSGYAKDNRFYTRRPIANSGALVVPKPYFGFSSGPIAVSIAAQDTQNPIYLIGFDMGPDSSGVFNNVYADTDFYKKKGSHPTYTGNWIKQLITVMNNYPKQTFIRVYGPTTAYIKELSLVKNLQDIDSNIFTQRINSEKDI
jgi:hypothetical protein